MPCSALVLSIIFTSKISIPTLLKIHTPSSCTVETYFRRLKDAVSVYQLDTTGPFDDSTIPTGSCRLAGKSLRALRSPPRGSRELSVITEDILRLKPSTYVSPVKHLVTSINLSRLCITWVVVAF